MSGTYTTVASALITLGSGATIISTNVDRKLSGTLKGDGTISLVSAVYGPSGVDLSLTNDGTIELTGAFHYVNSKNILDYQAGMVNFHFPSLAGIDLRGAGTSFVNNGTVLGNAYDLASYKSITGKQTVSGATPFSADGLLADGGGAVIVNTSKGFIGGQGLGVDMLGTLNNEGTIAGLLEPVIAVVERTVTGHATTSSTVYRGGYFGDGLALEAASSPTSSNNVTNSGTIMGASAVDVFFGSSNITNQASGLIEGNPTGSSYVSGGFAASGCGIYQFAGYNTLGAYSGTLSVVNAGTIEVNATAPGGARIYKGAGIEIILGAVTNTSGGLIAGYGGVVESSFEAPGYVSIVNQGTILGRGTNNNGYGDGVDLMHGRVTNSGTIESKYSTGIAISYGGTVTDSGLIAAGTGSNAYAIDFGRGTSRLILDPGARISGTVVANASYQNVLQLGDGKAIGTLAPAGNFIGFETVVVAGGADWLITGKKPLPGGQTISVAGTLQLKGATLAARSFSLSGTGASLIGSGTILPAVKNGGTITASGGTLDLAGAVKGSGKLVIATGAELELGAATAQVVTFTGTNPDMLKLDAPTQFTGTISGLAVGDVIDIASTTVRAVSLSANSLFITLQTGTVLDYALGGALGNASFAISGDGGKGSDLTFQQATAHMAFLAPVATRSIGAPELLSNTPSWHSQTFEFPCNREQVVHGPSAVLMEYANGFLLPQLISLSS